MLPPRAYAFIGLNIIRVLSIISLVLVLASNISTIVHDVQAVNRYVASGHEVGAGGFTVTNSTGVMNDDYIAGSTVPNQPAGAFWAVLNRLLIIGQAIVLILSEFGRPRGFFERFFPVLGRDFGVGALGIMQCLIGAAILSHRVDTFTLVSAFFLFSIGCLNMFVGLIFREHAKSKRSVTSWREHAKSALPTHVGGVDVRPAVNAGSAYVAKHWTGGSDKQSNGAGPTDFKGFGFGRQGEKKAGMNGFLISKPIETLPRYAAKPTPAGSTEFSTTSSATAV